MRRDLNYFSKYHVAPAKASPLKLAAISAFAGIVAIYDCADWLLPV